MPGTTDHRDTLKTFALRAANGLAHVRFTLRLAFIFGQEILAQCAHGFQDALEKLSSILALFNLAFPPQFVIVITCGLCQQIERITLCFFYYFRNRYLLSNN